MWRNQVGDACSPELCGGHGARCTNTISGYECLCPFGWVGRNCKEKIKITQPAFTGRGSPSSYLSITRPKHILRALRLGFKFKATSSNSKSGVARVGINPFFMYIKSRKITLKLRHKQHLVASANV